MDHIPRPIYDLSRPSIKIPYICTPHFIYDDLGFLTYPDRLGIDVRELCSKDMACSPLLAPFVQAWLWFGLLGETLGIGSRSNSEQKVASCQSFIETLPGGDKILNTTNLKDAVLKRRKSTAFSSAAESFRERFDSCLIIAAQAANSILETPTSQKQVAQAQSHQDLGIVHLILLSVQILTDSLRSYRGALFSSGFHHALPRSPELGLRPDLLNVLLGEAGWCRFQIWRTDADLPIKFFLSSTFKNSHPGPAPCSQEACSRWTASKQSMRPRHSSATCICETIKVPVSTINAIAQKKLVALLTFSENSAGKREFSIQETSIRSPNTGVPYVAFSHVRSRGLGNTAAHSLPFCQLSLLQDIANDALGSLTTPVPFYIDTMCLPLERDQKKQSLKELAMVFDKASAVVVLDHWLMAATTGSDLDRLLRIRYSDWKTRLWTLQEGSLAKKLLFRFANGTYDLDEVLQRFEPEAPFSILSRALETNWPCFDSKLTLARLQAFDYDMKSVIDWTSVGGPYTKTRLRTVLRLGYLGFPRYRYFRENSERVQSSFVLHALETVYFEGLSHGSNDLNPAHLRLEQMHSLSFPEP